MGPPQQCLGTGDSSGCELQLGLMPDRELVVRERRRDHAEQLQILAAGEVGDAVIEDERQVACDRVMHRDLRLLRHLLECPGVLRQMSRAEGEVDVDRYPLDLIRRAKLRLDSRTELLLNIAGKCERQAIALNQGNRHVRRDNRPPARADLLKQLLAEAGAKRILNVQQVLDLRNDQHALRLRTIARDRLPLCPVEPPGIQKPCAGIVIIEPVKKLELTTQRACTDTNDSTDHAEESRAQQPVSQLLSLACGDVQRHERPEQQPGKYSGYKAAAGAEHQSGKNNG